jgi:hypothetical protein
MTVLFWPGLALSVIALRAVIKYEMRVRVERAVREARMETAHWLGFQEGADHFHYERPEPRVMSPELFDVFTRDAQAQPQEDWGVLREFQQGKVDGFRQTAEMEIELDLAESDVEQEFRAWLRGREAA